MLPMTYAGNSRVRSSAGLLALCLAAAPVPAAEPEKSAARHIELDDAKANQPVGRSFDLSVGSASPGR